LRKQVGVLLLLLAGCGHCFSQLDKPASEAFVRRIVGDRAASFVVEYIPAAGGKDVYELESRRGKVVLRGSNGLSVGSALNEYLRSYCHSFISWDGDDLRLPEALPVIGSRVRRVTPYQYRYYLNYCTFNYSMAWWDWDRWQREIDWMTLNGINMPETGFFGYGAAAFLLRAGLFLLVLDGEFGWLGRSFAPALDGYAFCVTAKDIGGGAVDGDETRAGGVHRSCAVFLCTAVSSREG
jgi:hypothetical protein